VIPVGGLRIPVVEPVLALARWRPYFLTCRRS
jgi:hypothetical protein